MSKHSLERARLTLNGRTLIVSVVRRLSPLSRATIGSVNKVGKEHAHSNH